MAITLAEKNREDKENAYEFPRESFQLTLELRDPPPHTHRSSTPPDAMAAPECEEMGKRMGRHKSAPAHASLEECILFFKGDSYGDEVIQEATSASAPGRLSHFLCHLFAQCDFFFLFSFSGFSIPSVAFLAPYAFCVPMSV